MEGHKRNRLLLYPILASIGIFISLLLLIIFVGNPETKLFLIGGLLVDVVITAVRLDSSVEPHI
jgi:hypothetical protein